MTGEFNTVSTCCLSHGQIQLYYDLVDNKNVLQYKVNVHSDGAIAWEDGILSEKKYFSRLCLIGV